MRYFPKKRRSSLSELMLREYGVPCPAWTSMQVFRYLAFGPRRKWVKIFQTRQNSLLELSGDLLWLTIADRPNVSHNVMKRILGTGQLMTLYTSSLFPRLKETEIYEIPDPVYRSSIAQEEYQPVLIGLRKGSVLTRHNLDTGRVYDMVNLGPSPTNTLAINYVADVLVIKSPRLFLASQSEHFFRFHVFQLHPFKHLVTFDIESGVFPSKEHRQEFGKLRNAEIHDGLLLVMTEKNFNLIYDAEKIIQDCVATQREVNKVLEVRPVSKVSQAPRLLFSTYAHLDILGLGGCPWTYIRALSDSVVEVRDMGSGELLGNGRVTWSDGGDQIAPDFLMFHPDDSSRVIHVRTQEIRILGIHLRNGNRVLEEEFIYPEKRKSSERGDGTRYSRSGRLTKPKFKLDDSLNRALSFNVETDMRVLVILEARRDGDKFNSTMLEKLVFYDSFSYELLHQMDINVLVEGDIETNRLSVSIDRDVLNIVSHKGSQHTVLSFRLKEYFSKDEDNEENVEGKGVLKKNSNHNFKTRKTLPVSDSDDGRGERRTIQRGQTKRKQRIRSGNNRMRSKRRSLRKSPLSESEDSSDWTP
ncbi:hypothetical protein O3P69_001793 [Scylla paramamosain]|uniref:Uncharacterized protein n=3 Tax=Scylla paramamosain TaxID=85552 RepID=A0AAW0V3L6_SCYPA